MFRLSIRNLVAKKLRLLTTAIAIVLGVAFTAGTMILADTMTASFSSAVDDIAAGVDVAVRGPELGGSELGSTREPVPIDALTRVRSVPGVTAAAPYWEGYAQVVGSDGKVLDTPQSVGLGWIDDPELSMFEIVDGRAPRASGEVALGDDTAADAGVAPGDRVDLVTTAGRETFVVTGLAHLDGGAELGNTAFAFLHPSDAPGRLAEPGTVDAVVARGDQGVDQATLAAAVAGALPGADVTTGADQAAEQKADIGTVVGVFETILLVFGGIALFVGSFTIANTFTITVAQRTKELALVRAVGASRRQVLGSVVAEAAILGTVSALAGLAGGLAVATGLTTVFAAVGLEFPDRALVVEPSTVVVALLTGIVVTVVAAFVPARRASRVAPVDAMRDATQERTGTSRRRLVVGVALAGAGLAALWAGVVDRSAALVGLGSLVAFLSSVVLGPVLVRPVTAVLTLPLRHLGVSGRLAAANAVRNPRRSAATAAALTIGVMLVAGASMFATTARATIRGDVAEVVRADAVVRPVASSPGVPVAVASAAATVTGARVVPMQVAPALVDGSIDTIAGLDVAAAADLVRLELLDGAVAEGGTGLVVGDRVAADRGWTTGSLVEVAFPDGTAAQLPVDAVVRQTTAFPAVIAPYALVSAHGDGLDRMVLVGGDTATVQAVEAALAGFPTAVVDTVDGYAASLAGALDMVLSLVIGFLGLAVVIAVLGIATTIGLSVHERTRELGVLRSVGMSRRQLRRTIRLESIVIALFGTAVGMAMGIGFTWAVLRTLEPEGFVPPVVPVGTLLAVTVGAVVAGALAAALPARRAARMPVLEAVRTS